MRYELKIADTSIYVETNGFELQPDEIAGLFINKTESDHCDIVLQALPALPAIGGNTVFEAEQCIVKKSGDYEIRIYRDAIHFRPFAICIEHDDDPIQILCHDRWLEEWMNSVFLFNVLGVEKRLIENNKFVFHTCFTAYENSAILFSGFSGIGKSTQGSLWEKHAGAHIVNGDRCAIGFDENSQTWKAYGFPFSGTSGICRNESHDIKAVVFLKWGKENSVRRLCNDEASLLFWSQVTINQWNSSFVEKALSLIEQISSGISVYELTCTPDERAVNCLREELYGSIG